MAEDDGAARLIKDILRHQITFGFDRDDFDLAIAALEIVLTDDRAGIGTRGLADADAQRFTTIAAQRRALTKEVLFDQMAVILAVRPLGRRLIFWLSSLGRASSTKPSSSLFTPVYTPDCFQTNHRPLFCTIHVWRRSVFGV